MDYEDRRDAQETRRREEKANRALEDDIESSLTGHSWVQTDIESLGAEAFGYQEAAITVQQSVTGMIKAIDAAIMQTHSGKL